MAGLEETDSERFCGVSEGSSCALTCVFHGSRFRSRCLDCKAFVAGLRRRVQRGRGAARGAARRRAGAQALRSSVWPCFVKRNAAQVAPPPCGSIPFCS
eukprot:641655-Pleurochrysis_carterae.AAC.3